MGTMGPTSSSSEEENSSDSGCSRRHSHKKEKKHRKRRKKERKEKKGQKHAKKRRKKEAKRSSDRKRQRGEERTGLSGGFQPAEVGPPALIGVDTAPAGPPFQSDVSGDGDHTERIAGRPSIVPMSQEEAAAAAAVTRRVFEPETGRTRLMKASGEIVEEMVSKRRQNEIRHHASTRPSAAGDTRRTPRMVQQYTGRDKFPSQHPWFGMK